MLVLQWLLISVIICTLLSHGMLGGVTEMAFVQLAQYMLWYAELKMWLFSVTFNGTFGTKTLSDKITAIYLVWGMMGSTGEQKSTGSHLLDTFNSFTLSKPSSNYFGKQQFCSVYKITDILQLIKTWYNLPHSIHFGK